MNKLDKPLQQVSYMTAYRNTLKMVVASTEGIYKPYVQHALDEVLEDHERLMKSKLSLAEEQNIRDYYETCVDGHLRSADPIIANGWMREIEGIRKTLTLLGKIVEGVNSYEKCKA